MREQLQSRLPELTKSPSPSTLGRGGITMDQGQNEQSPIQHQEGQVLNGPPEASAPMSPFTRSPDQIRNPELKNFAETFEHRMLEKPLNSWETEELRAEYLKLHALTSKLEQVGTFAEKEQIPHDALPYSQVILQELERRGVDTRKLFLEATKRAKETGIPTRSIGAATADHFRGIAATTPGSDEELSAVRELIMGDEEHTFSPNQLDRIPDPNLRARIEARAPDVVKEIAETFPTGDHIPRHILAWIAKYARYTDQFITRTIMAPFTTPSVDYRLEGFYASTNLTSLIEMVEKIKDEEGRDYRILWRAVEFYHSMNRVVNSGQIDQYAQISPHFPTEFFDVVKDVPGIAEAKRLYEIAYRFLIERDKAINNANMPDAEKWVRDWLKEETDNGILQTLVDRRDQNSGLRSLEDWEIKRASDLARSMLTIEFRTSEKISMGELELANTYASSPQESATRLTDWFRRMGFKFNLDEVQGGVNLMKRVKEKFRTLLDRKYPWLGASQKMRLKKINNTPVDDLELAGVFGVRGVWDGYRLDSGVLDQIVVEFDRDDDGTLLPPADEKRNVSFLDFRKAKLTRIIGLRRAEEVFREVVEGNILTGKQKEMFRTSLIRKENVDVRGVIRPKGEMKNFDEITVDELINAAKRVRSPQRMEQMNTYLQEVFTPFLDKVSIGLGAFLTSGALRHPNLYKVREMIWKKVIDYDPLIIASTLSHLEFIDGVKFDPNTPQALPLSKILYDKGFRDPDPVNANDPKKAENDPKWQDLQKKLILAHEKRIKASIKELSIKRKRGGIRNEVVALDPSGLDPEEVEIVNSIRENGRLILQDLSLVRFPYAVFLDDLPFKEVSYREMGPEFFRRRTGSDLPFFAEAQKAWITLIGKAAQLPPEKRMEQFEAIMDATGTVLGVEDAQDYVVDSLFEGDCEFIEQYGWAQQFIMDAAMELAGKPTSAAQEYGGTEAPALNTYEMSDYLKKALNHGILRREGQGEIQIGDQILLETWDDTYEDFRRRTKATRLHFLWALLRDFLIGFFLSGGWKFTKEQMK